jgi:predicted DNA-binding transcriptional regulator YafY
MPRDAGRNAQTLRILGLLEHLASLRLGASLEDLAEHCGVETRTIRRDFDAIEALGYGIDKTTVSGRTRYRLDRTFASRIPRANLNVDELTALLLAFDSGSHAMPYGSQLASARRKIEQALPEPLRAFMIDARAALTAHLAPPLTVASATQARYLQDLIAATREHRQVMMGYGAAYSGTRKRYRLEPYRVVASQGAFYLVAWVPSAAHWRVFALHRIESVTLRETHFEPAHTLAADPFGHSLGPFIGEPNTSRSAAASPCAPATLAIRVPSAGWQRLRLLDVDRLRRQVWISASGATPRRPRPGAGARRGAGDARPGSHGHGRRADIRGPR